MEQEIILNIKDVFEGLGFIKNGLHLKDGITFGTLIKLNEFIPILAITKSDKEGFSFQIIFSV